MLGQPLTIVPPNSAECAVMSIEMGEDGYHVHTEFPTTTEKWIDVDLSEQRVVAYEGTKPVCAFIVSTDLPRTPIVTATFRIWAKTSMQDLDGSDRAVGTYYLETISKLLAEPKSAPSVSWHYAST